MKNRRSSFQLSLIALTILLMLANLVPAYLDYQVGFLLRKELPSQDSLAERYLLTGDWPASGQDNGAITHYHLFVIPSPPKDSSQTD